MTDDELDYYLFGECKDNDDVIKKCNLLLEQMKPLKEELKTQNHQTIKPYCIAILPLVSLEEGRWNKILASAKEFNPSNDEVQAISRVTAFSSNKTPSEKLSCGLDELIDAAKAVKKALGVKDEGCFIASMVYGSYGAPEVVVFRRFRDCFLLKYWLGGVLVGYYYRHGPKWAQSIGKSPAMVKVVRWALEIVARALKRRGW